MTFNIKRRKHKDNPYSLDYDDINNIYSISFSDITGKKQCVQITKELYETFNSFELDDLKQMNEFDRHIDHIKHTDESLYIKSNKKPKTLFDEIEDKLVIEDLFKAINKLPDIQKRRLKMYYFENKTYEEIAKEEHCTKRAIKFSVDIALEKISNFLKK